MAHFDSHFSVAICKISYFFYSISAIINLQHTKRQMGHIFVSSPFISMMPIFKWEYFLLEETAREGRSRWTHLASGPQLAAEGTFSSDHLHRL